MHGLLSTNIRIYATVHIPVIKLGWHVDCVMQLNACKTIRSAKLLLYILIDSL